MPDIETSEVAEVAKSAEVLSAIETPQARELLEPTDSILTKGLEQLSVPEKLEAFRSLESMCAEIEGRQPRAVEMGTLERGDFSATDEKIVVDSDALAENMNLSKENLAALKKEVFSRSSEIPAGEGTTFKSYTECSGCVGSCRGDCSGSDKCYSTKR